jgi:predicted RNA-binding Zn-ribbon protein involved in translation (DUF1610 family)
MASAYAAACKCGYKAEFPISSTRAQHGRQWWYPHACETCRAVVSIDLLSDNHSCPQCGNKDVVSFEEPQPPEIKPSFWERLRGNEPRVPEDLRNPISSSFCYVLRKTFILRKGNHRCPSCGNTALEFFRTGFFD